MINSNKNQTSQFSPLDLGTLQAKNQEQKRLAEENFHKAEKLKEK